MTDPKGPSWEEVSRVFEMVADADPVHRRQRLDELCAGNDLLRSEVASLLAADQGSPDLFLEETDLLEYIEGPSSLEEVGLRAGGDFAGYLIQDLVAEGSMGSVFRARQETTDREVAIKALRPGLASMSLLKRFEQEVRVLGQLEHGGIAKIYEAGVHDGVPFFAMEFVEGAPVTDDARGKTREQRIDVFLRICDAVQYAHEHGVVHRDLKPANILVDQHGEPRVLDFGVARVTGGEVKAITLATSQGQIVGTLAYMSPEQAAGRSIDARADVYALGVILYELLAGRRPLAINDTSIPEAVRIVCEDEPTRLGEVDPTLCGDLETIVGKALEKAPQHRYPSAAALADDLRRSQSSRPIIAKPPSTTDQIRKFARRHRTLVAAVVATMITLVIGTAVAVRFALIANDERDRAREATETANAGLYRMTISAAMEAARVGDGQGAKALLLDTPAKRRGFEYDYVEAQLDASIAGLEGGLPIEWLPDDETLLLAGGSGVMLWKPSGSGETTAWRTDSWVVDADTNDDGQLVAAAAGRKLHVWRTDGAAPELSVTFDEDISSIEFAPQEPLIATATGTTVFLVNTRTGEVEDRWGGHLNLLDERQIENVQFSPDGRWLLAVSRTEVALRNRQDEGADRVLAFLRGKSRPRCVFHADGQQVTIGGYSAAIETFNLNSGERVGSYRSNGTISRWGFDEGRRRFVVSDSVNGGLGFLDAATGETIAEVNDTAYRSTSLATSQAGRIAAGLEDHSVRLYDADGEPDRILAGHDAVIEALVWNRAGTRLASGTGETTDLPFSGIEWLKRRGLAKEQESAVRVWDPDATRDVQARILRGHQSWLAGLAFSPDGAWLATGGYDRTIRLWEVDSGDGFAVIPFNATQFWGGAFSEDGTALGVDGSRDHIVDLTDGKAEQVLSAGASLRSWVAENRGSDFVEFGRNGALGPEGIHLTRRDDYRGFELLIPPAAAVDFDVTGEGDGEDVKVRGASFRPDGEQFAVSFTDGSVRVWDTSTRRLLTVMRSNGSNAYGVSYSPDGSRIASGHKDGAIRLWDAHRHELISVLRGHEGYVHGVAFSPDGRTLASVSGDQTVRLWETRPRRERIARANAARARRDEVRPQVLSLFEELGDAHAVKARLDADPTLSNAHRRSAQAELLQEALRRRN